MASFNKVILMGNVTRDIELRYTPAGKAVAEIGLAVNRKWRTEEGEEREEVCFVDVAAFGRTAEVAAEYSGKGKPLHIEGRLKLDQWDDKQTGQKRSKLRVVCESLQLLGTPRDTEDRGAGPAKPRAKWPGEGQPAAAGTPAPEAAQPEDDDVPF